MSSVRGRATVIAPAVAVAALAWASGGYFPRTWGIVLLAAAIGLLAAGLLGVPLAWDGRGALLVGGLLALLAWQLLSWAWNEDPDAGVLEAERTLVLVGAAMVGLVWVPPRLSSRLVLGVLLGAGTVVVTGLGVHAFSSGVPLERLEDPIGYTNAAGMLATVAVLLGLGLVPASPGGWGSSLVAAPTVFGAVVLYLSLSRGSILALALGLLLLGVTARPFSRVPRMGAVALPAVVGVAVVAKVGGFADKGVGSRELALAVALTALSVLTVVLAAVVPVVSLPRPGRRVLVAAGLVTVAVLAVIAIVGGRGALEARSAPAAQQGAPDRLLSTSTSSRSEYWEVAGEMIRRHPILGTGAGSFGRIWLRERPALLYVRDAHNLYLETLAELGPFGLAALLLVLGAPLLGVRRAVRHPSGAAVVATYVALLAHAALDWDWELPAVTLCTVLLAVALIRLGGAAGEKVAGKRARVALVIVGTTVFVIALGVHVGNGAAAEARDLLDRGDPQAAMAQGRRAHRFMPWATEPLVLMGEAALTTGDLQTARERLRQATTRDPDNWSAWFSLALASRGAPRERALAHVRRLNPLAPELAAVAPAP